MSGVAGLYNVPSTQNELNTWAFIHAAHHRDINRRIYQLSNIVLSEYPLDPFDPNNAGVWTYQHQAMHQQFDPLLNINGYDLLDVNWTDPNELAGWIFLNASEHYQAAQILNLG